MLGVKAFQPSALRARAIRVKTYPVSKIPWISKTSPLNGAPSWARMEGSLRVGSILEKLGNSDCLSRCNGDSMVREEAGFWPRPTFVWKAARGSSFCPDLHAVVEHSREDAVAVDMPIGLSSAEKPQREWDLKLERF